MSRLVRAGRCCGGPTAVADWVQLAVNSGGSVPVVGWNWSRPGGESGLMVYPIWWMTT